MAILTIDFDIVMGDSVNFYNEMVGKDDPISSYFEKNPAVPQYLFPLDFYKYQYLTRLLIYYAKQKVPITFIESHEELVKFLQKEGAGTYDIINIDHHHDIAYDIKNPISKVSLGCGSWVKFGKDIGVINSYTWIKNDNSSSPETFLQEKYLQKTIAFNDFANKAMPNDLSHIFVCASWEWVPPVYHPLFKIWMSMYEEIADKNVEFEKF